MLLVLFAQSGLAETPSLSATGNIVSVIVFSDRAVVRRIQTLPADKGSGVGALSQFQGLLRAAPDPRLQANGQ